MTRDTAPPPEDPMVALLHEARCRPELWKGSEHLPWSDDHHEWDVATVKALRLLGATLDRERAAPSLDVERLARALPHATDDNPLPDGTVLGGHSYQDWQGWYERAAAAILAALREGREPG